MGRVFICVLLASGCGSVQGQQPDGGVDAATGSMDTPPRCDRMKPFGAPVPVTELDTTDSDENARLSPDELTVYFSSNRPGGAGNYDIYTATRATVDEPFSNVHPVMGVDTTGIERSPVISGDGLALYAIIDAPQNYNIGRATRPTTSANFSALTAVTTINSAMNDTLGSIVPDESVVYFTSDRGGNTGLYSAVRMPGGDYSLPKLVPGTLINTADSDGDPVISPDQLTLFFSSNRIGGLGGADVWMAQRANVATGFDAPINLVSLNSGQVDVVSWVSADGCVVYLTRGPCCTYDILVARRGR
jgi:Tol biopolymer transport system component